MEKKINATYLVEGRWLKFLGHNTVLNQDVYETSIGFYFTNFQPTWELVCKPL